jgi:hypothetical protein
MDALLSAMVHHPAPCRVPQNPGRARQVCNASLDPGRGMARVGSQELARKVAIAPLSSEERLQLQLVMDDGSVL